MKKIIISMLVILPLIVAAQKPAGWLTSYADATFENGKIVYTVSRTAIRNNPRLLPLMLPKNLVSLRTNNRSGAVGSKYIVESQQKIRDYLTTEPINLRSAKEQNEYLRLAAMVLLWDMDLSPYCLQEIKKLKASKQQNRAKEADILLQVYEIYQKNR